MTSPDPQAKPDAVMFRDVTKSDIAWVRDAHRTIYVDQLGWPPSFMDLVDELLASIAPRLITAQHDPFRRERGWVATLDGTPVGAIFVVQHDEPTTAKLRMLVVSSAARGHGIGTRLVDHVVAFARECGYSQIDLWTEDTLEAARRLYAAAGFQIVETSPSEIIPGATAETWRLTFSPR